MISKEKMVSMATVQFPLHNYKLTTHRQTYPPTDIKKAHAKTDLPVTVMKYPSYPKG